MAFISPLLTRANNLSPLREFTPTIPPEAKQTTIAKAPLTAAIPVAIATKFIGKGNFAPLEVASATAPPDLADVLTENYTEEKKHFFD